MRKSRSSTGRPKKSVQRKNTYHRSRVRELREADEILGRLAKQELLDAAMDAPSNQAPSAADQYMRGYLRGFYGGGEYVSGSYASETAIRPTLTAEPEANTARVTSSLGDETPATDAATDVQRETRRDDADNGIEIESLVPPQRAEYLLYFCLPAEQREAIPGDLLEIYTTVILPKFGVQRANRWYWFQVLRSIWPLLTARVVRVLKWALVTRVAGELWKRFVA